MEIVFALAPFQFDPLERPNRKKFEISKIQDGGGRHLEKSKIGHISGTV